MLSLFFPQLQLLVFVEFARITFGCKLFFILFYIKFGFHLHGVSRAEFSLTEPIPLQAVYIDHSRNPQLLYGYEDMDMSATRL